MWLEVIDGLGGKEGKGRLTLFHRRRCEQRQARTLRRRGAFPETDGAALDLEVFVVDENVDPTESAVGIDDRRHVSDFGFDF